MKKIKILMYVLIIAICMLLVSVFYPYISEWAMAHRESCAPGGELLLWLVPFMVCVGVSTARLGKRIKKQGGQKNEC